MNRRTGSTRRPRRGGARRTTSELPDLGRWIRQIRDDRGLTRSEAAGRLQISEDLIKKIERGERPATPTVLEQIITGYGLDESQARHTRELAEPATPLPSIDQLRARPLAAEHLATLRGLDERGLVGAYLDPLWNVVYANERFHAEIPDLAAYDDNLAQWYFHPGTTTPTAEPLLVHWDAAAAYMVASLRVKFGIHRHSPQARALHEKLSAATTFRKLWTSSTDVAYGHKTMHPLLVRHPGTGEQRTIRIHLGVGAQGPPDLRFCFVYPDPCDQTITT
ncbi:helix-turn-helix domain-containing protein [Nocardia asteroides]|uniref:helix-turn-helix domain-containing protein n=1 Tax=Nocardia asteroides TaxID=1824 RepID=UPI001E3DCAC4|nr:helix-turn-helix domain-containing protein [Nocardia asteroides]UGT53977.1 helix-turn-helix transcriptional regulator [Nocardia asteroides]